MTQTRFLVLTLALGLSVAANNVQAKIVCWTNSDGIRECGNVVPPEYAQQKREQFNAQGVKVKTFKRALTKAELAEAARQKAIEEEKQRLQDEQDLRDKILLSTFSSEDEIIMMRDGKITAIKTEIRLTSGSMTKAGERLRGLRKRAANLERASKPLPDKLLKDIAQTENQIKEYEQFLATRSTEHEKIHTQFESDMERFRKLRPKRVTTTNNPPPGVK